MRMSIEALNRRVAKLLASLEAQLPNDEQDSLNLSALTDGELDRLHLQTCLNVAVRDGDESRASQLRRWLSWSPQDLVAMFLSIDVEQLADKLTAYPLSEVGYRNLKINHLERGRIDSSTLDYLRQWADLACVEGGNSWQKMTANS